MFSTDIGRNLSFLRHPSLFHFILSFLGGFFNINLFSLLSLHRCLIWVYWFLKILFSGTPPSNLLLTNVGKKWDVYL